MATPGSMLPSDLTTRLVTSTFGRDARRTSVLGGGVIMVSGSLVRPWREKTLQWTASLDVLSLDT